MASCRNCDNEGGGIPDGNRIMARSCKQCLAETCILDGKYTHGDKIIKITGNKMGFTTLEGAMKLCDCFARGHPDKKDRKNLPASEEFLKNIEKLGKYKDKVVERNDDVQQVFQTNYEKNQNPELYEYKKDPTKFPKINRED